MTAAIARGAAAGGFDTNRSILAHGPPYLPRKPL